METMNPLFWVGLVGLGVRMLRAMRMPIPLPSWWGRVSAGLMALSFIDGLGGINWGP